MSRFATAFACVRPIEAPARAPDGSVVMVQAHLPRYDYADGRPALLVERGARVGLHDAITLLPTIALEGRATVLHARADDDVIERRAIYTRDPRAAINGCLGQIGRHLLIGVVPGYLVNRGGHVRYDGQRWALATLLTAPRATDEMVTPVIAVDGVRLLAT